MGYFLIFSLLIYLFASLQQFFVLNLQIDIEQLYALNPELVSIPQKPTRQQGSKRYATPSVSKVGIQRFYYMVVSLISK